VRRTVLLLALALVVAAAFAVPLPVVAIVPGPAVSVAPLVRVGAATHPVNGKLLLTTVRISEPPLVEAVADWLDRNADVLPREAVIPPGVDEKEYIADQQRVFRESAQVAAAVGLRAAGQPVQILGSGAEVSQVIKGSPAEGKLREGDVIVEVDGRPVRLASDVVEATGRARAGDEVRLGIRRGQSQQVVTVLAGKVSQLGRPGIGVLLTTVGLDVKLPFPVDVNPEQIGGPSAGLMLALSVYDLVSPADLAHGRTIAGTGTIDLAGNVGQVGGVRQKVLAAKAAGATVFLVPTAELADARAGAPRGIELVSVHTFDDALKALARAA
jgi:PDZ domain-containing protein